MMLRRMLWGVIAGLTLLVIASAAVLGWTLLRPRAQSTALLIAGTDSRLRLLVDGEAAREISADMRPAQYRFPAISPDGRKVAYVGADGEGLAVFSHDLASGERHKVYSSELIAPFDIGWSPDSRHIVFLAPTSTSLVLMIVPEDGSAEPQPVAAGSTVYFTWSTDGSQLALHVGGHALQNGRVDLYRPGESNATPLTADPGFFQAPAFSHDGSAIFYVSQPPITQERLTFDEVAAAIVRVNTDGNEPKVLVNEKQAALRVVRSPADDTLAYGVQHFTPTGSYEWGALKLIGSEGGEPRTLSRPDQRVDAFFWSPDGKEIAYLAYMGDYTPRGPRTLHVVNVADGSVRDLGEFTPSQEFADLNLYFDAYLHGFTPWSPDSARLAYAADDGVYVVDTAGAKAEKVGEGTLVFWAGGGTE